MINTTIKEDEDDVYSIIKPLFFDKLNTLFC